MIQRIGQSATAALALWFSVCGAAAAVSVPLQDFQLPQLSGLTARLEATRQGTPDAVRIVFDKDDPQRRMLFVRAKPTGAAPGARAVAFRYRLQLDRPARARFAALVREADGESWVKVARPAELATEWTVARVSVAAMRPTDFSPLASGTIEWGTVRWVCLGLVLDGSAKGTLEISEARLTDEPQHPTAPLRLTGEGPGAWTLHKDAAAQGTLTTPNEGPVGQPCLKVEFTFPGGRHMFCTNSLPMPSVDLEGYRALRLTYKATPPPGISGLLVLLSEDSGACYRADPMPTPSAEWKTSTIPLDQFRLAEWTQDPDGTLDMEKVVSVWVGAHGVAAGAGGAGTLSVCDLELVPFPR
ncbi:MAG: hypothetical protein AUJ96_02630 [Armatimonadetes bacterium CG2_30_66_41]|nr:hypothetical protein [Armatimonadota bacterium]NCO92394.1 hypothetical protein [Armatimonadota bacterium]NDK12706.1 hypothetical protein [Armatimonadota bacterium]OIP11268.1 MAG: hypothetical protein AUJ96_02630 [Armatimonadetes bacterium CG2_30_66_41]PIX48590.1 MAG: hypothetical protein COZ57_05265 [Armatimonadetes bacterium CG_4_8_14_3_um_filter_66_20]